MRTSLFFGALLLAGRLAAQDADADIVVTATKEPAPADTLPVPVVILGQDDLAGKSSVSDALSDTLAVRLQSQTPGQPALIGPGTGDDGIGRVALLVDGMVQGSPDSAVPPLNLVPVFALDRVEVIGGPMSALYGSGAGAGAVNLITRIPRKFEAQMTLDGEWGGTNRESAAAGLPVGDGGLLISLARDITKPSRDRSDSDHYQGWLKLDEPVGNQRWSLWAGFTQESIELPGALTEAAYKSDPDQTTHPSDSTDRTENSFGASWGLETDLFSVTVPLAVLDRNVYFTTVSGAFSSYTGTELLRVDWEPRFNLKGTLGSAAAEWGGGVGVLVDRLISKQYTGADFSVSSSKATVDRDTGWIWNHGQLSWNQDVFLSADARAELSRTHSASSETPSLNGSKNYLPLSGDLGITWLPDTPWKLALQVSRVYRYPSTDEMITYSGYPSYTPQFFDNVDAEEGQGATVSAAWSQDPWDISLSGTVMQMKNEIGFDPITFNPFNLGPIWRMWSLASGSWKHELSPGTKLAVGGEYGLERAVFASGTNEGNEVPLIPMNRGRLWAKLQNTRLGAVEADWSLSSSFVQGGDETNTEAKAPGRQTIDATCSVFLGSPALVLRIYGKNLTNDRTPDFVGFGGWYPSEGRVFGVSLNWTL